jgi:hypothetical protein
MTHSVLSLKNLLGRNESDLISKIKYLEAANNIQLTKRTKRQIDGLSDKKFMGSALVLTITDISGNEVMCPIAISDGLSSETIEVLKKEVDKVEKMKEELYDK